MNKDGPKIHEAVYAICTSKYWPASFSPYGYATASGGQISHLFYEFRLGPLMNNTQLRTPGVGLFYAIAAD